MTNAFNYLKSYKADTRASYAYTQTSEACTYNAANGVVNTLGYTNVAVGNPLAHIA
jgi:hypothetical protein